MANEVRDDRTRITTLIILDCVNFSAAYYKCLLIYLIECLDYEWEKANEWKVLSHNFKFKLSIQKPIVHKIHKLCWTTEAEMIIVYFCIFFCRFFFFKLYCVFLDSCAVLFLHFVVVPLHSSLEYSGILHIYGQFHSMVVHLCRFTVPSVYSIQRLFLCVHQCFEMHLYVFFFKFIKSGAFCCNLLFFGCFFGCFNHLLSFGR